MQRDLVSIRGHIDLVMEENSDLGVVFPGWGGAETEPVARDFEFGSGLDFEFGLGV